MNVVGYPHYLKNELDDSLLLYTFSPTRPDKWKDNPNTGYLV